jgi:hypothetical protein
MDLSGKFPFTPSPLPKERGTCRGQGCIVFMGAMREQTLRWLLPPALSQREREGPG